MVLLHAASRLAPSFPRLELHVIHVNHGLRGRESDGDESFVRSAAERLGLHFHLLRLEGKRNQAECREAREAFFRKLASRSSDRVLTAHHLDDQAETVFLRLLRGTGLRGLAAMAPVSGKKLRPFLELTRREIADVARAWQVEWREDSSNAKTEYERNWLRHEIFPLLERRRPGLAKRLAALASDARELAPASQAPSFLWKGHEFFRRAELLRLDASDIAGQFALDREGTRSMQRLLKKGNGAFMNGSRKWVLSSGILFREGEEPFSPGALSGNQFRSELGTWTIDSAKVLPFGGDTWKKRCQETGIPVFFRASIPYGVKDGKKCLLLSAPFEASPLGRWFFSTSESHRVRRHHDSLSRGEVPRQSRPKEQSSPKASV